METGNHGRFYDWHYDYDNNGQLEINEYMDYEEMTFGSNGCSVGSGGEFSGKSIVLTIGFFLVCPILIAVCPPLAILLIAVLAFL